MSFAYIDFFLHLLPVLSRSYLPTYLPTFVSSFFFMSYYPSGLMCATHIFLHVWPSSGAWSTNRSSILKKTNSPFTNIYQLLVASPMMVKHDSHLPSPSWSLNYRRLAQDFFMLSEFLLVHLCSFSFGYGGHCFLVITHCPYLLMFFCPFFFNDPWGLEGGGAAYLFHLGLNIPKSPTVCILISLESLC